MKPDNFVSWKIDSFRGEYFFLSNFYPAPITYEGLTYQNTEAAFQAQKCANPDDRIAFTKLNASEAKHKGRKVQLRKDWEQIKLSVMGKIVSAKFEQNVDLALKLLATGESYLEEGNDWGDRFWGTVNGKGANNLGQILMRIREYMEWQIDDAKRTQNLYRETQARIKNKQQRKIMKSLQKKFGGNNA